MHRLQFFAALSFAGMLSAPVYGGTLEAYSGVVAGVSTCPTGGGPPPQLALYGISVFGIGNCGDGVGGSGYGGSISDVVQSTGTAVSASVLNNYSSGNGAYLYSGAGSATAEYGLVTVGASGTQATAFGGSTAESVGFASAADTHTFVPTGTNHGATGFEALQFTVNLHFTMSSPYLGNLYSGLEVKVGNTVDDAFGANIGETGTLNFLGATSYPGCVTATGSITCTNAIVTTALFPVTFGVKTPFEFGYYVVADPIALGTFIDPSPSGTLTGITLYEADGITQIPSFTITSGSGAVYGADGIESQPPSDVPEPATLLLVACALPAFAWVRRKRRSVPLSRRRVEIQTHSFM